MRLIATFLLGSIVSASAWAADTVDYVEDVLPILESYCIGCHTADEAQGGLVMESHQSLMSGGDSGVAITAGAPASSRLLLMLTGQLNPVMPPEGEERPSEREMEILTTWVEQGAGGPDGEMPLRRELKTPQIEPRENVAKPVTAIALSPDGRRRAIGRFGVVEILNEDDSVVATLSESLHKVNSLEFSRDGSRILVGSGVAGAYGNAAIFSINDGQLLLDLVGHRDVLYAAVFSPDESMVATAGYDREILLWDVQTGETIRRFHGHNGAVFDLAFSPDAKVLASACADETVKVWNVATGKRLDTLSQPEGEVFAVDITSDGKFVIAGSADNRLRVWRLKSTEEPQINPIRATRYVDESALVGFSLTPDGKGLVVLSEAGNLKVIRTSDWNQAAELEPLGEAGSDLSVSPDGKTVTVSVMDGRVVRRALPQINSSQDSSQNELARVYMDLGEPAKLSEHKLREQASDDPSLVDAVSSDPSSLPVPRGAHVDGTIDEPGQADYFRWQARAGEVWAIDVDAAADSPIDPIVSVLDRDHDPVLKTRLQAVRDSYFTFRGKDSTQIGDFRVFNWQEMHLNDYLFAAGEVTRLWMYPRGPDSGYNVYPNDGSRWTYFGTTQSTHALGEPAYIVQPLDPSETPVANGLPVFDVYYENDDDPRRLAGKNSRVLFVAPSDDVYTVRVRDTRGDGGPAFGYQLRIRAAEPRFVPSVSKVSGPIRPGSGREFTVRVDRIDGFDGPVTFDVSNLPVGLVSNFPLTIESGQRYAVGTIWIGEQAKNWEGKLEPKLVARAQIGGQMVERQAGSLGELTLGDPPSVIPSIQPIDRTIAEDENWTLKVRRGETVSARVIVRRKEGFTKEISFGKENSGRNASHGVYVDNIGLNGLLVRANEDEREFFLTADLITEPGKRSFFLTGAVDGNITTHPITVEVLP